jgi:WD40 repeat protein
MLHNRMTEHPKFQTASDGTLLLNFGQYGREVEVAAISGDGRRILTVHDVGKAEVWDAHSGSKLGEICPDSPLRGTWGAAPTGETFKVFIESASLNREGSIALLGLNDGTAGTFRVADGLRLATLHPPGVKPAAAWAVIRAVAYSPNGSLALVGFRDRSVGVWSESGERRVAFLVAKTGSRLVGRPFVRDTLVSTVAASADDRWVFAGCVDMTAAVWNLQRQELVFEAVEHAEKILSLFDNAEGLGWATTAGSVWQSCDGGAVRKVIASDEHWAEARFHGDRLLTRGFDGTIRHWSLSGKGARIFQPEEPDAGLWSSDAETLASLGEHEFLYPESGRRLAVSTRRGRTLIERNAQIVSARFCPGGNAVGIQGWRDEVELWSIPGWRLIRSRGRLIRSFACPGGVGDFAFSEDGNLIAIGEIGHGGGHYPRHVFVYETASGRLVDRHSKHDWQVSRVTFSPQGGRIASLGNEVILWELERPGWFRNREVLRIEVDAVSAGIQFLSNDRLLVLDRGRARVFRNHEQVLLIEAPIDFQTCWCVSKDGRTLNVALNQGMVRFDLDTGEKQGTWIAPIPRPEYVPTPAVARETDVRVGAALWRTEYGMFTHQSDGPRGWIEPVKLSPAQEVVLPALGGAAIVSVASEQSVLGLVPFEGKLRAARIVDGEALLVNETGKLFRSLMPSGRSAGTDHV